MGIYSAMAESRAHPSAETRWLLELMGGKETQAGKRVTPDNALGVTGVWSAVKILAETVAMLPLVIERDLPNGGKERARDHRLYSRIHNQPNQWQTSFEWREMMQGHLALRGNAYSIENPDGSLMPVHPDRFGPMVKAGSYVRRENGELVYEWKTVQGGPKVFFQSEVLHLRGFSKDGVIGISPITEVREAIGLSMAAEGYGARLFSNDARPGGVIKVPAKLKKEQRDEFRNQWNEGHKGTEKAHSVAILDAGMEWESIGMTAEDAQFLAARNFQLKEIARIFRIPPHMMADLERASFSNIEQQARDFVQHTMMPWFVRWEQALWRDLLLSSEQGRYSFKFVVEALLRGDTEARGNFYQKLWGVGAFSANEILGLEGRNPIDGGDKRFVPMNMIPVDEAGLDGRSMPAQRSLPKETRSLKLRTRLRNAHRPLFESTIARYLRREIKALSKQIPAADKPETIMALFRWMEEFYEAHKATIARDMKPVLSTYSASVKDAIEDDMGVSILSPEELDAFVNESADKFARREANISRNQIEQLARDSKPGDVPEILAERLVGWEATRHIKVARRQIVTAGEATTKFVIRSAGFSSLSWRTSGQNCPICDSMDGRIVGISEDFVRQGDTVEGGDSAPMTVKHGIPHPPLHDGCDCFIVPA